MGIESIKIDNKLDHWIDLLDADEFDQSRFEDFCDWCSEKELLALSEYVDKQEVSLDWKTEITKLEDKIVKIQIIEALPKYPVSKKIWVIINWDKDEERHLENTNTAIHAMIEMWYEEIYVAQTWMDDKIIEKAKKNWVKLIRKEGDMQGINDLFEEFNEGLIKDSLVFLYVTWHGINKPRNINVDHDEAHIDLVWDIDLSQTDFIQKLSVLNDEDKKSRIVAVMDQCYSWAITHKIAKARIEWISFSPWATWKTTRCQHFSPHFFDNLSSSDLDDDMQSDEKLIQMAFFEAMKPYRSESWNEWYGEVAMTLPSLTATNFDEYMEWTQKPVLIQVTADRCGPCQQFKRDASSLWWNAWWTFDYVEIDRTKWNLDWEPEWDAIFYGKIWSKPNSIPSVYISTINAEWKRIYKKFTEATSDLRPLDRGWIAAALEHHWDIKVDKGLIAEHIVSTFDWDLSPNRVEEIESLVAFWLRGKKDVLEINDVSIFLGRAKKYSKHFSPSEISYLYKKKISHEMANAYPEEFWARNIELFWVIDHVNKLTDTEKLAYAQEIVSLWYDFTRFWILEQNYLHKQWITSKVCDEYDLRFGGAAIKFFEDNPLLKQQITWFSNRREWYEILNFMKYSRSSWKKITPTLVESFDSSFSGWDIVELLKHGVASDQANEYYQNWINWNGYKFTSFTKQYLYVAEWISLLVKSWISADTVNEYDPVFYISEITDLHNMWISGDLASEYIEALNTANSKDIQELYEKWVTPQFIKQYMWSAFINKNMLISLSKNSINLNDIQKQKYDEKFNWAQKVHLVVHWITMKQINQYPSNIDILDIAWFIENKCSYGEVEQYLDLDIEPVPSIFSIRQLWKRWINPEEVKNIMKIIRDTWVKYNTIKFWPDQDAKKTVSLKKEKNAPYLLTLIVKQFMKKE